MRSNTNFIITRTSGDINCTVMEPTDTNTDSDSRFVLAIAIIVPIIVIIIILVIVIVIVQKLMQKKDNNVHHATTQDVGSDQHENNTDPNTSIPMNNITQPTLEISYTGVEEPNWKLMMMIRVQVQW